MFDWNITLFVNDSHEILTVTGQKVEYDLILSYEVRFMKINLCFLL